jgi:hypothetical protein
MHAAPILDPTQPPIQRVLRYYSLGVKRPGHGANCLISANAEAANTWCYTIYIHCRIYLHRIMFN